MKASSLRNFVFTTKCKSANIRLLIRHKHDLRPHDWGAHFRFSYSYSGWIARKVFTIVGQ